MVVMRMTCKYVSGCVLWFLILWHSLAVAEISMSVDPQQVQLGDTFRVVITVDDKNFSQIPDVSALQKDFTVIGTQQSVAYSNYNGHEQSTKQWIILLYPKAVGKLIIPSIKVGNDTTSPSYIDVEDVPSQTQEQANDKNNFTFIKTSVIPKEPFVNQQILYTMRFYNRAQLANMEYVGPRVDDGLLINVGDGRQYQTRVNDDIYTVSEQQYVIFPQKG